MMCRLAIAALLLLASPARAAAELTCGCEWSPWTRTTYLSCSELRPDGSSRRTITQQPFAATSDCEAAASKARADAAVRKPDRAPAGSPAVESVYCDCEWNPWKANFLLSCTARRGAAPTVRLLDRLPFGAPRGRKGDAERSCMTAKGEIERKYR